MECNIAKGVIICHLTDLQIVPEMWPEGNLVTMTDHFACRVAFQAPLLFQKSVIMCIILLISTC